MATKQVNICDSQRRDLNYQVNSSCLLNYVIFQVICFRKTLMTMIHVNGKFDESHLVSLLLPQL